MITNSALKFILSYMDFCYNDLRSLSPRYPVVQSMQFIDFCVGFLYRCGVLVHHDEVSNSWQVIK